MNPTEASLTLIRLQWTPDNNLPVGDHHSNRSEHRLQVLRQLLPTGVGGWFIVILKYCAERLLSRVHCDEETAPWVNSNHILLVTREERD